MEMTVIGYALRSQPNRFGQTEDFIVYFCVREPQSSEEVGQVADWIKAPRGKFDINIGDTVLPVYDRTGKLTSIIKH